ncbi:MAG TPA: hypothetical protein VFQ44_20835 [Streptosporangiaceae bacterium]|nr:hypothetical protein [Streptosporangiaceae bacterium]
MGNAVVHFEVAAADDGLLVAFYGDLFGWRLRGLPGGGYTTIDTCAGHGINGGITKSRLGEPCSVFYVEVEDLRATLDKATSLGGTTVVPETDVSGIATIAMFKDLDGLPVGLVKAPAAASGVYGSEPSPGSGEILDWFEVMGSDAARTQHFYSELFDWTLDDAGFPEYAVVDTGSDHGIQGGLGGGQNSRWATTYVWVRDLDEVFSRVEKLGGSRVLAQGVPELKDRSRFARYGVVDQMKTGAVHDPAGNVVGVFEFKTEGA